MTITHETPDTAILALLTDYEIRLKRRLEMGRHHPGLDADRMDDTIKDLTNKMTLLQSIREDLLNLFYNSYAS